MYLTAIRKHVPERPRLPLKAVKVLLLIAGMFAGLNLKVNAGTPSANITFSGHNVSLEKVFSAINKQAGYQIFCDYALIREARKVDVNVKDASVQTVLDNCLKGQALSYEIIQKTIVIARAKTSPDGKEGFSSMVAVIDISGRVTNEKGEPVPAATIVIKGTNKATSTNENGEFHLSGVEASTVLVISSIGYEKQEVKIAGRTTVNVQLKADASSLAETVVTALGITKEQRKLGYAVTTVSSEQFNKAREANVALSLSGQVAGLNVHGASGGPGSTARILMRGLPSINSPGSPLFVINGVPMDNSNRGSSGEWGGADAGDGISNINPDDIENMTILKGQAASALYGTRASNGVILITTKKGKKGEGNVEYNVNAVWDKPINNTDYQYVYGQGTDGAKPVNATGALNTNRFAWGSKMDGSSYTQYDGKTYSYSPFRNNLKNFYRTGPSLTNTVAASGGGERGTYRFSVSNLDNSAIVRNAGLDRKTINFNLDQKVTDKLSIAIIANYIDQQDRNRAQLSDGPGNPNNFNFLAPNVDERIFKPGFDASGNEIVFSDDNYVTNPWFVVSKWINSASRKRYITSMSAKYNFNSWIYAMARLGYDLQNDRYMAVTPSGTNYSFNSAGQSGQLNNLSNAQTSELNIDGIVGINHTIVDDLKFDATLGFNDRRNFFESIGINGNYFVVPGLYTPTNVLTFGRSYDYSQREVHSGYYSVDFSYKDYLDLTTTGRLDAFSTLPAGNRTIFTPSVAGSFVFSNLMKGNSGPLSYGKLRASYAKTSGEPANAYSDAVYYSVGNSINGIATGSFSSTLPNLFLKPFTKTETEIGTELKFLNNRLSLDVAYYWQKTNKEIMNASLSNSTGYSTSVVGTGSTQNRGLEVQVSATPVRTQDFSWNISLNYSHVKSKILHTDLANNTLTQGAYRPLNANTAFIVGKAGPQVIAHDFTYDSKGEIVVDGDGLPIQDPALKPYGSVLPTDFGGLRNDFSYKNWNASFLIDYNYGNKILSATSYYSIYRGLNKMTLTGRETGITTGVTSSGAANTKTASAQAYYQRLASISKVNVLNGDYIKLRQVTIGYNLNPKLIGNIPLFSAIQVSLVARNLWTIHKKSDNIDPENNFAASVQYAGIEGTSLPFTRTFGFNIKCNFKK